MINPRDSGPAQRSWGWFGSNAQGLRRCHPCPRWSWAQDRDHGRGDGIPQEDPLWRKTSLHLSPFANRSFHHRRRSVSCAISSTQSRSRLRPLLAQISWAWSRRSALSTRNWLPRTRWKPRIWSRHVLPRPRIRPRRMPAPSVTSRSKSASTARRCRRCTWRLTLFAQR